MPVRASTRPTELIRAFRQAQGGAAAIEFAIVGMPFFLLVCGILVIGFMMFCTSSLDYATQKAARQVMVGTTQNAGLNATQFRTNVVCPLLPSPPFDCSKVVVNLTTLGGPLNANSFINANLVKSDSSGIVVPPLDNSKTSFCTGGASNYQVLEVLYPLPVLLSLFATSTHVVQGQFVIMSTAGFKNENFQGGSTAQAGC